MRGKPNDPPVSLGKGLRSLISTIDRKGNLVTAGVIEVWDHVVGPEIADHTFVSGVKEGELVVLVDSPVWVTQLNAMSEQLKARLWQEIGQENVRSLRFTLSRRVSLERHEKSAEGESTRGYADDVVTPQELSADEMAAVLRSVSAIEDENLRAVALRATLADLERKKARESHNSSQKRSHGPDGAKIGE